MADLYAATFNSKEALATFKKVAQEHGGSFVSPSDRFALEGGWDLAVYIPRRRDSSFHFELRMRGLDFCGPAISSSCVLCPA